MPNFLSEKTIEDILSVDRSILGEVLSVEASGLSLVSRQKDLPSGRLDLLYLYQSDLLLIELKIVPFYDGIITQINGYFEDLKALQKSHRLIDVNIKKIIVVTGCTLEDVLKCQGQSIELVVYDPAFILSRYYENFKELSYFLKIQSGDHGVVRIGLVKSTLRLLSEGKSLQKIAEIEKRSAKTLKNRLSIAAQLGIVTKHKQDYFLTDFGRQFVSDAEADKSDRLSENQAEMLTNFVIENPFYSSVTYTILTLVESVFILAKSTYPIPRKTTEDYFVKSAGKTQTWKTEKARKTATYIYANYACELELLSNIDNHFYLTKKGIQAILLLQLNRSIKLIESQY